MSRYRVLAAGAAAVLVAAGCAAPVPNRPGVEPTSSSPPTNATPSQSVIPTSASLSATCPVAAPPTLTVSKGSLPKGKSFGFVHHFDGTALFVDPAEMFGNEAAVRAAREDGEIGRHEDLPDPFYIRNRSKAIVRVPVSARLRVFLLDNTEGALTPGERRAAELAALYCGGDRPEWVYSAGPDMPANLTLIDGEVVRIEERYLP